MLKVNCKYFDNSYKLITIGGRIKKYCEEFPFVWSIGGDWYDEKTGAFVSFDGTGYVVLSSAARNSISNHVEINCGE